MDVEISSGPNPHLVPIEDQPVLNPRLGSLIDPADASELEAIVREDDSRTTFEQAALLVEALGESREILTAELDQPSARPGLHNCVLLETQSSTHFTINVRRELETLRSRTDWKGTAAATLFGLSPEGVSLSQIDPVISPIPLNDSQIDAVLASRAVVTVVTGPPGTGKSQVVTALGASAWVHGQSFLITSTNNAAVDVASTRLQAIDPILVLRSGNPEHRQRLAQTCGQILQTPGGPGPSKHDRQSVMECYRQLDDLRSKSIERSQLQLDLLSAHVDLEAASDNILFTGTQPDFSEEPLIRRMARLSRKERPGWWARRRLRKVTPRVGIRSTSDPRALHRWAQAWLRMTNLTQRLKKLGPLTSALEVSQVEASWMNASLDVLQKCAALARQNGKSTLRSLADQRTPPRGRPLLEARDLQHLRGWAVTALSVAKSVPLDAGVVDLLILDEASQCSLAHVLPLAYRAERAVILGDPHQLRPIVQASAEQEATAAQHSKVEMSWLANMRLSFRENSAFDAFERSQDHIHLLNEHYRCHPAISGWFNREFYSGALTILTSVDPLQRRGIETMGVDGLARRGPTGSWVNEAELALIVDLAGSLVQGGESLGVVTPYRSQARAIQAALSQRYGAEWLNHHDVAVATAHRFQGSERDVILFSSVVTPETPVRSARWLEVERHLLNVGASRARRLLVLVGHPGVASIHGLETLDSLWNAATSMQPDPHAESSLSEAEQRFWRAFDTGLGEISPRQRVEGYDVDFTWTAPWGTRVAIEIDDDGVGEQPRSRRMDIERDKALNRVEWQVVRIPGWYCFSHPDAAIDSLRETLTVLEDPTSSTVELMPWVGR